MIKKILNIIFFILSFILIASVTAYFTLTRVIKSEDTVVVPLLEGKDIVYTLELLTDLGLNTKVKGSEYNSNIPKNHITFQEPGPGTEIKKGRDIRVVISKGPKTVIVPNISGIILQQARIILEENDLRMGKISYTHLNHLEKEHVVTQVPYPGTFMNRGEPIDLLISLGPRPKVYKMPDLNGISIEEAILTIEKYNLKTGNVKTLAHQNKRENTIIGQYPLAGHRITENDTVNLVVNNLKQNNEQPDWFQPAGVALFRYRTDIGLLNTHIRIQLNNAGISMDLFNDFLKPGEEIWFLIPSPSETTLFLYKNDELFNVKVYN